MQRVGDFTLTWGESLRWDDRRERLYFVDCANRSLHRLDQGEGSLNSLSLIGMPTGVVLTEGDPVLVCLDDGIYVVDTDAGTSRILTSYPDGFQGRANDANADGFGNLITGTLNLAPGPGSLWWFSAREGWKLLDEDFGSANGPVVLDAWGEPTLVIADTLAGCVYAYPYDGKSGTVGERRMLADSAVLGGVPDGATVDAAGGVWSCVLGAGKIARLTSAGVERSVEVPAVNPSDLTFGGRDLDRLFVTSIALGATDPGPEAGSLLAFDDLGVGGVPESRFSLSVDH